MTTIPQPIADAHRLILTLERIASARSIRKNLDITAQYKATPALKIACKEIERTVAECEELVRQNPPAAEAYYRSLKRVSEGVYAGAREDGAVTIPDEIL